MSPFPSPETDEPLSEMSRLSGVLFEPKRAFSDIAARPRFWAPLILVMITSTVFIYAFSQRVGWERVLRDAIESSSRAQGISAEQMDRVIEQQVKFAPFGAYAGALVGTPVSIAVIAAVLMLMFRLAGGEPSFRQMFGITSYAYLPTVIASLLALLVLHLKRPEEFDLRNPLAFNLGAFLPEGTSKWLASLGSSIDLFSLWTILLLATGGAAACRGMKFSTALLAVAIPWAVWVALKAGAASIFG